MSYRQASQLSRRNTELMMLQEAERAIAGGVSLETLAVVVHDCLESQTGPIGFFVGQRPLFPGISSAGYSNRIWRVVPKQPSIEVECSRPVTQSHPSARPVGSPESPSVSGSRGYRPIRVLELEKKNTRLDQTRGQAQKPRRLTLSLDQLMQAGRCLHYLY